MEPRFLIVLTPPMLINIDMIELVEEVDDTSGLTTEILKNIAEDGTRANFSDIPKKTICKIHLKNGECVTTPEKFWQIQTKIASAIGQPELKINKKRIK